MSVGGLVGAVAGGVIGFFIGGPIGAFYGASLGFALGMAIDPLTPDIHSVGDPDQGDLVMSGEVGTPIADLAGTAKITGHLLCYGGERSKSIYGETSGGKGGEPDPVVTGYKYYMSWAVGIMAGKANTLYAVYENDDVVWEGELDCPASGGEETITLDGMGSATFYFGTDDHALNSKVGALLDDADLNVPYRNLCWCFFDDCYIGEYNRAPTMKFVVKKIPANAFSDKHEIQTYDCNPAHAKWFILHDLTGLPESWLHSTDFAAEALTLWGESRGLSILFDRQQSALSYLESINSHIDSILRYGTDGKFHPKLIRDDYTVGDLPLIDEDVMLDEPSFDRRSWIDTLNEMKVQYSEIIDVTRTKPFGPLWGWGDNGHDSLGLGTGTSTPNPIEIEDGILSISNAGFFHSASIDKNNVLKTVGNNEFGKLGLGDTVNREFFEAVDANEWIKASLGYHVSVALRSDSSLYGCGWNNSGELGLGDKTQRHVFTHISNSVSVMSMGYNHLLVIKISGTLWSTGKGAYGALGLGDYLDKTVLTQVGSSSNWSKVFAGSYDSFILSSSGALYGCGWNHDGALGIGDEVQRNELVVIAGSWKTLSIGGSTSLGIKADGTLWAAGTNTYGQLGLGDTTKRTSFTQVGSATDWKQVAVSRHGNCAFALNNNGDLYSTGQNASGVLGLGDYDNRDEFTQIPGSWKAVYAGGFFCFGVKN